MQQNAIDIQRIVGDEVYHWLNLQPRVFYRDGLPYGLVGALHSEDGITYVAASTESPEIPFSIGMLKEIMRLNKEENICLITDDKNYIGSMKKTLQRYGFRFVVENDILYSYNDKG